MSLDYEKTKDDKQNPGMETMPIETLSTAGNRTIYHLRGEARSALVTSQLS